MKRAAILLLLCVLPCIGKDVPDSGVLSMTKTYRTANYGVITNEVLPMLWAVDLKNAPDFMGDDPKGWMDSGWHEFTDSNNVTHVLYHGFEGQLDLSPSNILAVSALLPPDKDTAIAKVADYGKLLNDQGLKPKHGDGGI